MASPSPRTWATIDLCALRFNLARVRELCPTSHIVPVVKSDAYGHGMIQVAQALLESEIEFDLFAVATLAEALELKQASLGKSVMVLAGCINEDELRLCFENEIQIAVHCAFQEEQIFRLLETEYQDTPKRFWVKYNSGMNRLGQRQSQSISTFKRLATLPNATVVYMSHLAYADDMNATASRDFTEKQIANFSTARDKLKTEYPNLQTSFAASAGILTLPQTHDDYVRPGVMLYGSSPLANESGSDMGLKPVMTLSSRLMAINDVRAGESIGYNATYTCNKETKVGVVSIGYGDGYPRSATSDTPVLVKTSAGIVRTHVIGRVSMDMITIDLTPVPDASINDEVILWGQGLGADEVAKTVGTIAYELFCKVTKRVDISYVD